MSNEGDPMVWEIGGKVRCLRDEDHTYRGGQVGEVVGHASQVHVRVKWPDGCEETIVWSTLERVSEGRCDRCGFTLAASVANRCVPGNCSYRCGCSPNHRPGCLLYRDPKDARIAKLERVATAARQAAALRRSSGNAVSAWDDAFDAVDEAIAALEVP